MVEHLYGFLVLQNVCLATDISVLRAIEAEKLGKLGKFWKSKMAAMATSKKCVNIGFWYQYILKFPKIYRFPNLQNICTKLHKELD